MASFVIVKVFESIVSTEFFVIRAQAIKSGAEAGSSLRRVTSKPTGLSASAFANSIIGRGQRLPKQSKITFDLAFPALQGALKNYVDSKLIILRQDINELNKQVFGLIIAGQFLPAVFSMSETAIVYNTVSEFVSNQLSLIVNQLIANLIGKGDVASGTNFDIAYNRNPNFVITDFRAGNELQVSLKQSLFNDRLTVMVGGNLDNNFFGGSSESTTFLGNDVVVEYDLSKDKSLKFRVYQKLQPDFSGRRLRFGAGVSYRKEFESFSDFLSSLKKNN